MKRHTFDRLMSVGGLVLTVVLLVAGILALIDAMELLPSEGAGLDDLSGKGLLALSATGARWSNACGCTSRGGAMRALVVYESMFGNTRSIARAIEAGLRTRMQAEAVEVGSAPREMAGITLLVVGGPTHAWSMSRARTRRDAQPRGEVVSRGIGIREWLEEVTATFGLAVAAFDTRFKKPRWMTGSAARHAAKRLRRMGTTSMAPPESFFVAATSGPLIEGEVSRAREWGAALASAVAGTRKVIAT